MFHIIDRHAIILPNIYSSYLGLKKNEKKNKINKNAERNSWTLSQSRKEGISSGKKWKNKFIYFYFKFEFKQQHLIANESINHFIKSSSRKMTASLLIMLFISSLFNFFFFYKITCLFLVEGKVKWYMILCCIHLFSRHSSILP